MGAAAFVIPLRKNLIFTEINEGDEFGQLDLFYLSVRDSQTIEDVLKRKEKHQRLFTALAVTNIIVFQIRIESLLKMNNEFNEAFDQFFQKAGFKFHRLLL